MFLAHLKFLAYLKSAALLSSLRYQVIAQLQSDGAVRLEAKSVDREALGQRANLRSCHHACRSIVPRSQTTFPCSAQKIPCSSVEQGIGREAMKRLVNRCCRGTKWSRNRQNLIDFPVKFAVLREVGFGCTLVVRRETSKRLQIATALF